MKKLFITFCVIIFASTCFADGNVTAEWRDAGFNDYDASHWMVDGFDKAAEAKAWRDADFSSASAKSWQKKHISPVDARDWKAAGVADSKRARKLSKAGLTPESYKAANPSGDLEDDQVLQQAGKGN